MRALLAQTRVELALTLRRGESLLATFAIPVGLLVFFAKVDVLTTDDESLVPMTLAIAIMASAMVSLGIATGFERAHGVLRRLGATPLGRPRLVAAKVLCVLVVQVLQSIAILLVALMVGVPIPATPSRVAFGIVLGTAAFSGIGLAMAGRLRADLNLAVSNGCFIALMLLGGAIVPLERLPGAIRAVARFLPIHPLTELLGGTAPAWGVQTLVIAIWAICSPLVAALTFSWD